MSSRTLGKNLWIALSYVSTLAYVADDVNNSSEHIGKGFLFYEENAILMHNGGYLLYLTHSGHIKTIHFTTHYLEHCRETSFQQDKLPQACCDCAKT